MTIPFASSREHLVHALYEAAELEHNLMCTYLYAAFSLKRGQAEGLGPEEADAVERWRRSIIQVAIEEMAHLTAVWNITAALGGAPRFGRMNFPLDPGYLPAGIVVKLAPFNAQTLQHFIFLERPQGSDEPEGQGFAPERKFVRGHPSARLTPMGIDYETVGEFYEALKQGLAEFSARVGEERAFAGDPERQVAGASLGLTQVKPVRCLRTALTAFDSIIRQGEGAPADVEQSHFQSFLRVRGELAASTQANPDFSPAYPAATNPVLRRPPRPEGRVWIENPEAVATVDLANASYALMLRLLAYAYAAPLSDSARSAAPDLGVALMRAITLLGEHAARLPAGPSNPGCHAGVSFITLRDAAALPAGPAAHGFLLERMQEIAAGARELAQRGAPRLVEASVQYESILKRAGRHLQLPTPHAAPPSASAAASVAAGKPATDATERAAAGQVEAVAGRDVEIRFEAKRCIHARFCVTGAPRVFLANAQGPWIHPDAMPVERVVEIAHACPSGAIQYVRRDGGHNETPPPVNLAAVREAGPYAFRGDLRIDGSAVGFRATLCRCGASANKPFCDGSHHAIGFTATGEPPTLDAPALAQRDGPLTVEPQTDGPLQVQGNLEIITGTGRVVARVDSARLCRCGGSQNKPFCDGTHARIGFRS
ncbi:MAG: CDGSH iron-sulfur domain-containing protein [Burkholderiaceae bacterium]|nr:CDGSH iron-sulfur domain-containing protein [Burkholderiaceae bacterium]